MGFLNKNWGGFWIRKLRTNNEKKKVLEITYNEFAKQKEFEGLSERTLQKYKYRWTEFERDMNNTRVREGLADAKLRGVKLGRPKKKDVGVV